MLSEHELWPAEGSDSFDESNFEHGALTFSTPLLVENTEVLELLKDLKVDFAQGFTISKPFPIESAELK